MLKINVHCKKNVNTYCNFLKYVLYLAVNAEKKSAYFLWYYSERDGGWNVLNIGNIAFRFGAEQFKGCYGRRRYTSTMLSMHGARVRFSETRVVTR